MSPPKQNRIQKIFCTTREAADLLGVSIRTAQLWSENGLLAAWKTAGGHRRITRDSIERLLGRPDNAVARWVAHSTRESLLGTGMAAPATFRILVVEDDASLRRLYQVKLSRWPTKPEVVVASNGSEALDQIKLHEPDLLVADLQMPGMDGFHMLNTIFAAPEHSAMAVVVVSGLDPKEISRRGDVPAGIPILPKPIPFDRLASITAELVARRQAAATEPPTSTSI